jgi:hypothetical protein
MYVCIYLLRVFVENILQGWFRVSNEVITIKMQMHGYQKWIYVNQVSGIIYLQVLRVS